MKLAERDTEINHLRIFMGDIVSKTGSRLMVLLAMVVSYGDW